MTGAVDRFEALVSRPDDAIDLAAAALTIAHAAQPQLDVPQWLGRLDELAEEVSDLDSLRARLFDSLGFTGDTEGYYDPRNSFLNRVIERRRGIPITLSVLTMEVGRRAGIKLEGVGMPGHFLVRVAMTRAYLDPFFGGVVLDLAGCEQRFRQISGRAEFSEDLLPVVTKQQILARMLANLKGIYQACADGPSLEWVVRMRMAIPSVGPLEVVELGQALALQGRIREGAEQIDRVAADHPALSDQLRLSALSIRASLN